MVTLLISAFAVLFLVGIAIYFWQKPTDYSEKVLPPRPDRRSLFADDATITAADQERLALAAGVQKEALIARAQNGERSALAEAHAGGDANLYDRVLAELVQVADSQPKLLSLLSFVIQNELPVNKSLAEAVLASWREAPDRSGTAKALHFAALSDDADIYRGAVESALGFWREGKLAGTSAAELRALFDGEFWILSSRSRSSGAGFVLKRTLEDARRELEAAGVKQ
jgi:hypothetical protein